MYVSEVLGIDLGSEIIQEIGEEARRKSQIEPSELEVGLDEGDRDKISVKDKAQISDSTNCMNDGTTETEVRETGLTSQMGAICKCRI